MSGYLIEAAYLELQTGFDAIGDLLSGGDSSDLLDKIRNGLCGLLG